MIHKTVRFLGLFVALIALVSCGSDSKTGSLNLVAKNAETSSLLSQTADAPTTFKICVKSVKIESESSESEPSENDDEEKNEISFSLGEVDLTSIESSEISLGAIPNAPIDFKASQLKIRVKKFGNCDHSIEYGEKNTDATVVFRWKFDPAIDIASGDTLDLFLSEIIDKIKSTDSTNAGSFRAALQQVQAKGRRR